MPQPVSIDRRRFAQILGAGAAYVAVKPRLTFAASVPQTRSLPSSIVRLSSNENPYGASPKALAAMADVFPLAGRYPDDYAHTLTEELARLHRIGSDQILLGNGSGEILKLCAAAFTGSSRRCRCTSSASALAVS